MENRRGIYRVLVGKSEGKSHLEDQVIDGRIILKWIFRKLDVGGMDRIDLAQGRGRLWALVNAVTNLQVP
jgi:hypothetical protein